MNGGDFIKNSILNLFGIKQSDSSNETLTKSKSISVMYLNKTKSELVKELDNYGESETFGIEYDIKCLDEIIIYLQK